MRNFFTFSRFQSFVDILNPTRWRKQHRIDMALVVLCFAVLLSALLSPGLWMEERSFPVIPVVDGWPELPSFVGYIQWGLLLLLPLMIMITSNPRPWILTLFLLGVLVALGDYTRVQPWFYQYLVMLGALGAYTWRRGAAPQTPYLLDTLRILLAFIYIWSGIHKINLEFTGKVFPWMVDPFAQVFPGATDYIHGLGFLAPFIEIIAGIGLLLKWWRRLALVLLIFTHLFILACIGPLGHNWNQIVWPWNVAMILWLIILFSRSPDLMPRDMIRPARFPYQVLVVILFGILPGLHLGRHWDAYLSSSLYSGKVNSAEFLVNGPLLEKLPPDVQGLFEEENGKYRLYPEDWAIASTRVPVYPEARVYRKLKTWFCDQMGPFDRLEARIYEYGGAEGWKVIQEDCKGPVEN